MLRFWQLWRKISGWCDEIKAALPCASPHCMLMKVVIGEFVSIGNDVSKQPRQAS